MHAAHEWVTTLFGHEWHIFDNETRQLVIVFKYYIDKKKCSESNLI